MTLLARVISLFANGEPGFLYDNNDYTPPMQWATNKLTYSNQFDNAVWVKSRATVTANAAIGPDGELTADKLVEDSTAANTHAIQQTPVMFLAGTTYTLSVYLKAGERTFARVQFPSTAFGAVVRLDVNLSTGAITSTGGVIVAPLVEDAGNGWYRCSFSAVATVTVASGPTILLEDVANNASYNGDGVSGLYLAKAQVNTGLLTDYQRITNLDAEYLAAFPLCSMFADSLGYGPAYVNGPLGLQLDAKTGSRTERRNLFSRTQAFDNAVWSKTNSAVTADTTLAPDGTLTADTLTASAVNGYMNQLFSVVQGRDYVGSIYLKKGTATTVNVIFPTSAIWGGSNPQLAVNLDTGVATPSAVTLYGVEDAGNGWWRVWLSKAAEVTSASGGLRVIVPNNGETVVLWGGQYEYGTAPTTYQHVITGNGDWTTGLHRYQGTAASRPTLRGTPTGAPLPIVFQSPDAGWADSGGGVATGTATTGEIQVAFNPITGRTYRVRWTTAITGGSIRMICGGDTGTTRTASGTYERYFTASSTGVMRFDGVSAFTGTVSNIIIEDVTWDSVSAPYGIEYDGVDDFLQTATADFTGTDAVTLCMGMRKLSDSILGMFMELSADATANNGAIGFVAPTAAAANNVRFYSRGTALASASGTVVAPATVVVTGIADISTDTCILRVNGAQQASSATDQGAGNYGNHVIYFGRRAGASSPFNGLDYGGVLLARTATAAELSAIEAFTTNRTTGA